MGSTERALELCVNDLNALPLGAAVVDRTGAKWTKANESSHCWTWHGESINLSIAVDALMWWEPITEVKP